jgi:hypothetical protein
MSEVTVTHVGPADVHWPFHGGNPYIKAGAHQEQVDPFPGYRHELAPIVETLEVVTDFFKPLTDLGIYTSSLEGVGRTNAWATYDYDDYDEETKKWSMSNATIYFSGKRIPPHPALTRYLVGHEYGHCVMYWIAQRELGDVTKYKTVEKEYAEMRGLEDRGYGGGRWHDNPGEVVACDFRILCGIEEDYWPHHGIDQPNKDVLKWWEDRL